MHLNVDEVAIDGVTGVNILDKFADVYRKLYNSAKDDAEVKRLENKVIDLTRESDILEVESITGLTVQDAL